MMKVALRLLVVLTVALSLQPATATPGGRTGGSTVTECGSGVITHSPTRLWPPNHKFHNVVIAFVEPDAETHDGDDLTVMVDAIVHDQAAPDGSNELNGSGRPNAGLDWNGIGNTGTAVDDDPEDNVAVTSVAIRAERSGRVREGRFYTITVTCRNANGSDESDDDMDVVDLTVHVPHSMSR